MPARKKINLGKVKASLSILCPQCGHEIAPAELRRFDFNKVLCPKCKAIFAPGLSRRNYAFPSDTAKRC
jgi:predicted RNA-binding Zn-ribbon protein involved in translation (DUF1610 family)